MLFPDKATDPYLGLLQSLCDNLGEFDELLPAPNTVRADHDFDPTVDDPGRQGVGAAEVRFAFQKMT